MGIDMGLSNMCPLYGLPLRRSHVRIFLEFSDT